VDVAVGWWRYYLIRLKRLRSIGMSWIPTFVGMMSSDMNLIRRFHPSIHKKEENKVSKKQV